MSDTTFLQLKEISFQQIFCAQSETTNVYFSLSLMCFYLYILPRNHNPEPLYVCLPDLMNANEKWLDFPYYVSSVLKIIFF